MSHCPLIATVHYALVTVIGNKRPKYFCLERKVKKQERSAYFILFSAGAELPKVCGFLEVFFFFEEKWLLWAIIWDQTAFSITIGDKKFLLLFLKEAGGPWDQEDASVSLFFRLSESNIWDATWANVSSDHALLLSSH